MKTEHKIIIIMAAAGVLAGVADAALDTLFFYEGSFLEQLAFAVPKPEMFMRITNFLIFVVFGIVISRYFGKARRAEEKLHKSAETYRTLFENSPVQTMVVDSGGKVTAFNLAKRLSGDRQPAIGDRMYVDYAGKHTNDMRAELMECISSNVTKVFPERVYGDKVLSIEISPFPEGAIIISRDITTSKLAVEKLEGSLSLLKATLESTTDGILVVDKDGVITSFNEKFVEMWRIPESILESRDDHQALEFVLSQLEDPEAFLEKVRELYNQPDAKSFDTLEFKDGRVFERYSLPQKIWGESVGRVWSFRDVTERKLAEKALAESEEKYRSHFENVGDVIYVTDREFRITSMSPSVQGFLGYHPDELIGQRIDELGLFPSEYHEQAFRNTQRIWTGKRSGPTEYEFIAKDGTRLYGEVVGAPLFKDGEVTGAVSVARDVTDRKRAEEALRLSETRYRGILDASQSNIMVFDENLKTVFVNRSWEEDTGYSAHEVKNAASFNIVYPDDIEKIAEYLTRVLNGESLRNVEYRRVNKSGEIRWVESNVGPVQWPGAEKAIVSVSHDITERKQAEGALRQSEEKYRLHFENVGDLVYVTDREFRITSMSPSIQGFLGYHPDEVIGRRIDELDILRPEYFEQALINTVGVLAGERSGPTEYEFIAKDGTGVFGEVVSAPRFKGGEVAGAVSVVRDISDRKRSEEALRLSEERHRRILDSSQSNILVLGENLKVLFVNRSWKEDTGYSLDEVKDDSGFKLLHPNDIDQMAGYLQRVMNGERLRGIEYRRVNKLGEVRWMQSNGDPVQWPGADKAIVIVAHDITERKQAEEALRESEERYRGLFENESDAVMIFDAETLLFEDANRATLELYGYSAEEFRKLKVTDISAELDKTELAVPKIVEEKSGHIPERRFRKKNGAIFMGEISAGSFVSAGRQKIIGAIRDITERKQMEEALRKSEFQYRTTLDSMNDAIHVVDTNLRMILMNAHLKEWSKELGLDTGVGQTIFEAFPFLPDTVGNRYARVFETAEMFSAEENYTVGGREISTEIRLIPVIKEGRVNRVVTVIRDITHEKVAEKQISKLSSVVDAMVDGVTVTDALGKIVYMNKSAIGQVGCKQGELTGEAPLKFIAEKDHEKFLAQGQNFLSGEQLPTTEYSIVNADGEEIPVSMSFSILHGGDGAPGEIIAVSRDITELKRTEKALQERTVLNQLLLDALPCVALLLRMPDHEIVASNKVGRDAGAVPGKLCFATWGKRSDPCPWCLAPTALEKAEPQHMQVDALDIVWDTHWYPMGEDLCLYYAFDITEKAQAEEERRKLETHVQHTQKLESLGVLAGGIAHDFNNLLTSILGNASLALMDIPPASLARDSLKEIEIASQHAAGLCRQMLAYSGKGKFIVEPLGLNETVREMAHLLDVSISKKTALEFHLAENLPAIEADTTQIRQVIMNLITNASEALGEESGTIAFITGAMECDSKYLDEIHMGKGLPTGAYVYLDVADTGCGMDRQTQAKIFDPFFTTKFAGRGLGLAAVFGIVHGHKGAIRVVSEPGKGATFRILFPALDRIVETVKEEITEPEEWRGSGTILLVDDERGVRKLGKRILEGFGFDVLVAADGQEAIEMFREHESEIVLILLDLTMPKMSGVEAFKEIRRINSDALVILSSGYNEEDAVARFAGSGLAGFLQKPYKFEDLREEIRTVLDG